MNPRMTEIRSHPCTENIRFWHESLFKELDFGVAIQAWLLEEGAAHETNTKELNNSLKIRNALPWENFCELDSDRRPVSPFQTKPSNHTLLTDWHRPCLSGLAFPPLTIQRAWVSGMSVHMHHQPFSPPPKSPGSILLSDWTSAIANLRPWTELEAKGGGMMAVAAATVDSRSVKLFNRVSGEKARQLFLTHQTPKKDKD